MFLFLSGQKENRWNDLLTSNNNKNTCIYIYLIVNKIMYIYIYKYICVLLYSIYIYIFIYVHINSIGSFVKLVGWHVNRQSFDLNDLGRKSLGQIYSYIYIYV